MSQPSFKSNDSKNDMKNQTQSQNQPISSPKVPTPSVHYYSPFSTMNTMSSGQYYHKYPQYPTQMHSVSNTFQNPYPYPPVFYPGYIPAHQYNNIQHSTPVAVTYTHTPPTPYTPPTTNTQASQTIPPLNKCSSVVSKPQAQSRPLLPQSARTSAASTVSNVRPFKKQQQPRQQNSTSASSHQMCNTFKYNLDDPEELEKWKAERRKKFPSIQATKTTTEVVKTEVVVSQSENKKNKIICDREEREEGEADEDCEPESNSGSDFEINKEKSPPLTIDSDQAEFDEIDDHDTGNEPDIKRSKRLCKYFAKGNCRHGDSCKFSHEKVKDNRDKSRSTVFEKLLKIEENESMLKFYECIKVLSAIRTTSSL